MKQIIKINDKNYKIVDNKETIYNIDILEIELQNAKNEIVRIEQLREYVKTLPIDIQNMIVYPPEPEYLHLEELINELKKL